jgi:type I restriction enzyme S subunit
MHSAFFRQQIAARKAETDMADYVSLTSQRTLRVLLPPVEVQQAIGRVLGALDHKIELNRRMNETLEAIARALFKDVLLGQQSADGPPRDSSPPGWRWGSIADLARFVNGRNFTKDATGTGRMVVRIAELNSGPAASTVYNDVTTDNDHIAGPDDVLFAWSGSLGIYRWHLDEALINQHIFKVICDRFPKWFVYWHLMEALPDFRAIASHKATTMGHIQRRHLSEATLLIPPDEILGRWDRIIGPIYELGHRLERQAQMLSELRDALLPRLISGEIRIGDAAA